jgi:hypothetical protein
VGTLAASTISTFHFRSAAARSTLNSTWYGMEGMKRMSVFFSKSKARKD